MMYHSMQKDFLWHNLIQPMDLLYSCKESLLVMTTATSTTMVEIFYSSILKILMFIVLDDYDLF